jgi:hypothetical protein
VAVREEIPTPVTIREHKKRAKVCSLPFMPHLVIFRFCPLLLISRASLLLRVMQKGAVVKDDKPQEAATYEPLHVVKVVANSNAPPSVFYNG